MKTLASKQMVCLALYSKIYLQLILRSPLNVNLYHSLGFFSRQKSDVICFFFFSSRKQDLTFHTDCLFWRQCEMLKLFFFFFFFGGVGGWGGGGERIRNKIHQFVICWISPDNDQGFKMLINDPYHKMEWMACEKINLLTHVQWKLGSRCPFTLWTVVCGHSVDIQRPRVQVKTDQIVHIFCLIFVFVEHVIKYIGCVMQKHVFQHM